MQPAMKHGLDLPQPDPDSARHSERVADHIARAITDAGGVISFAEYMQHALYAPGLGYYVAGTTKFGADGDFVTAPEVSPLFGHVLATQCAQVLAEMGHGDLLEFGAGSGALAVQVLEKLDALDSLPKRYQILEVSADLQQRQEALINEKLPGLATRVEWISSWPSGFCGVLLANEVVDALPVERFTKDAGSVMQLCVACEQGALRWQRRPAPEPLARAVANIETRLGRELEDGFESEVCLALEPWIARLSEMLTAGMAFLFDYGTSGREYYGPERNEGWLRCHFRHRAHDDPLILPGIQDITSWIDFSALAEAAARAGLDVAGYVTQAHFLIEGGLYEELGEFARKSPQEQLELSRQTKLLTLPTEMGENFKCIGLSRGDVSPPTAFRHADRAHHL